MCFECVFTCCAPLLLQRHTTTLNPAGTHTHTSTTATPGNAQYFGGRLMCASRPLAMRLLTRCRPSGWQGPGVLVAMVVQVQVQRWSQSTAEVCQTPRQSGTAGSAAASCTED
jgi:hypothetical protein